MPNGTCAACALAAILVSRRAFRQPSFFAERLLGPALGLIAILNGVDAVVRAAGASTLLLVSAWIFLSVGIALLQLIALMERLRQLEPVGRAGYSILIYRPDFAWPPPPGQTTQ